jgi:hypothetical protein
MEDGAGVVLWKMRSRLADPPAHRLMDAKAHLWKNIGLPNDHSRPGFERLLLITT